MFRNLTARGGKFFVWRNVRGLSGDCQGGHKLYGGDVCVQGLPRTRMEIRVVRVLSRGCLQVLSRCCQGVIVMVLSGCCQGAHPTSHIIECPHAVPRFERGKCSFAAGTGN